MNTGTSPFIPHARTIASYTMKPLLNGLLCCMLGYAAEAETMSVEAAQKAGLITVRYIHDPTSMYYEHPLKLLVSNNTVSEVAVALPNGAILQSADPHDQNLMVTRRTYYKLKGKETDAQPVYAMCMEKQDNSPNARSVYSMSGCVTGHLKRLAELIEQHGYYDGTAQDALWCFTSHESLKSITDTDTSKSNLLRHFVSNATGELYVPDLPDEPFVKSVTPPQRMYSGTVMYNLHGEHRVRVILNNENYQTVKECYRNDREPGGAHEINFLMASDSLPHGMYQMIFIVDDEERMRRSLRVE